MSLQPVSNPSTSTVSNPLTRGDYTNLKKVNSNQSLNISTLSPKAQDFTHVTSNALTRGDYGNLIKVGSNQSLSVSLSSPKIQGAAHEYKHDEDIALEHKHDDSEDDVSEINNDKEGDLDDRVEEWHEESITRRQSQLKVRLSTELLTPKGTVKKCLNKVATFFDFHRRSSSVASSLTPKSATPTDYDVIHLMQDAIKEGKEKCVQLHEIVFAFIDKLFTEQFKKINYHIKFEKSLRQELETKLARYKETKEGKVKEFIETEVTLRKEQVNRSKAAEIVYHLLCHEKFKIEVNGRLETPEHIAWMKACALRCGRLKKPIASTQPLANLLKETFIQSLIQTESFTDIYEVLETISKNLEAVLTKNGYASNHSNRMEAADAIYLLLKEQLQLRSNKKDNVKRLKLLFFINLAQCSPHFINYKKWHDHVESFFQKQDLETKMTVLSTYDQNVLGKFVDKHLNRERFNDIDIQFYLSSLFRRNYVSLGLIQSFFESLIERRNRWEESSTQIPQEHYEVASQNNFQEIFIDLKGPWKDFLTDYEKFSKEPRQLPAWSRIEELPHLKERAIDKRKKHQESSQLRRENSGIFNVISSSLAINDLSRKATTDLKSVKMREIAINRIRFFFSFTARLFFEMTIKESSYHKYFWENNKNLEKMPYPILNGAPLLADRYNSYLSVLVSTLVNTLDTEAAKLKLTKNNGLMLERWSKSKKIMKLEAYYNLLSNQFLDVVKPTNLAQRIVDYTSIEQGTLVKCRLIIQERLVALSPKHGESDQKKDEGIAIKPTSSPTAFLKRNSPRHKKFTFERDTELICLRNELTLIDLMNDVEKDNQKEHLKNISKKYKELILNALGIDPQEIQISISNPNSPK